MKRSKFCLALCVMMLFVSAAQAADDIVGDWLGRSVKEEVLPNGIRVLALDRGYAPVLALLISFKVGSVDESYESTGTAHMLEHMMFKGTETIGTRDYSSEKKILNEIEAVGSTIDRLRREGSSNPLLPQLEVRLAKLQEEHRQYVVLSPYSSVYTSLGGVNFNAGTSRDQTVYYIELPADSLDTWARLESERLRAPVFRQYYLERDAVMEERRMRYDSVPTSRLTEQFLFTVFAAHPYRHPVIGWEQIIGTLPLDTVRDFYYTNYVPSRMTITIVGKQDVAQTMQLVRQYFGNLPARPAPVAPASREIRQEGERRITLEADASPHLLLGWHKQTAPSKEDYVCDIISSLLTDGRSSRLEKALVEEQKLAARVSSSNGYVGARYDNVFVISCVPARGVDPSRLETAVLAEIEKLANDVTDEEVARVTLKSRAAAVFRLSRNMDLAEDLAYCQTVLGDWRYFANYIRDIDHIRAADVQETVRKVFRRSNMTVGTLVRPAKTEESR